MEVSSYLSKKYSDYGKDEKLFSIAHVQAELLCSHSVARLHVKDALGRTPEYFNYYSFEDIICNALD